MTTTANDDKAEKELSTANRPSKIRIENKRNQTLPTYPTLTVRYPSSNWEPDSPMIVCLQNQSPSEAIMNSGLKLPESPKT